MKPSLDIGGGLADASLETAIRRAGQPFYDEPVMARPKRKSFLELSLMEIFGSKEKKSIVLGHERIRLRWMKPDGKGGLTQK